MVHLPKVLILKMSLLSRLLVLVYLFAMPGLSLADQAVCRMAKPGNLRSYESLEKVKVYYNMPGLQSMKRLMWFLVVLLGLRIHM